MPRTPPVTVTYVLIHHSWTRTICHKTGLRDEVCQRAMKGQRLRVDGIIWWNGSTGWLGHIKVVSQSDAFTFANRLDLMLAVAVESCPLDCGGALTTPVKIHFFAMMLNHQVAAFEGAW